MTPTDLQKPPTETEIADIARLPEPISGVIRRLAFQRDTLVARVRELESGLTWTDAKPTVPGWYWHRSQAGQRADIGYYQDEQILLDGCLEWVIHLKGQFAGPIPAPKETPAK